MSVVRPGLWLPHLTVFLRIVSNLLLSYFSFSTHLWFKINHNRFSFTKGTFFKELKDIWGSNVQKEKTPTDFCSKSTIIASQQLSSFIIKQQMNQSSFAQVFWTHAYQLTVCGSPHPPFHTSNFWLVITVLERCTDAVQFSYNKMRMYSYEFIENE